jgi:6-pyruvoyltetrahydropterin/6-carboxytetrahydropterin synthase
MSDFIYEVSVEEAFSAAHQLRNYRGKCENLHGHNYKVLVVAVGPELDETGLLYDFASLKQALRAVVRALDHTFLNELPPFDKLNPSAENLARFIHDETARQLPPAANGSHLARVTVWETETSSATYKSQPGSPG